MDENDAPAPSGGDTVMSLFTNPDVLILLALGVVGNIGGFGLGCFVQGPATAYEFGNEAALITNINCIGTPLVALLFSVPFARWADRKSDPRYGLAWVIVGAQGPSFAMLFNGFTNPGKTAIWGFIILCGVVGPMRCQLSGNPVLWATYSDKVPPSLREVGFQLLAVLPSLSTLAVCPICNKLVDVLPYDWQAPYAFCYIQLFQIMFITCFFLCLLLVFLMKPHRSPWTLAAIAERKQYQEEGEEEEEISSFNYFRVIGNAFTFFRANKVLMAVAGALSVYTLPDLAASYPAGQIYYTIQNIAVVDPALLPTTSPAYQEQAQINRNKQILMSNWMTNIPTIIGFFVNIVIALGARKFGPARAMMVWVPMTCVGFGVPYIMSYSWGQTPVAYVCVALGVGMSGSVFPPLQALVTLAVPAERVGEALGCVAMCKDSMSLLAPILMMGVMGIMDAQADGDATKLANAYKWIFPGCGCLMFLAWPFVVYLAIHTSPTLPDMENALFSSSVMANTGPDFAASVGAVITKKAGASRNLTSTLRSTVTPSMAASRPGTSEIRNSLRESEVKA